MLNKRKDGRIEFKFTKADIAAIKLLLPPGKECPRKVGDTMIVKTSVYEREE